MLGHLSLPSALRGDLLDPAPPTGQAEQPRSPLRYVAVRRAWVLTGQLGAASGLFLATSRERQTSSMGRASGRSPALRDLLRLSTDLASEEPYWRRPGQFVDARHSQFPGPDPQFVEPHNSGHSVSRR